MPVKPRIIIDTMCTAWSTLAAAGGLESCSGHLPSMNDFLKRPLMTNIEKCHTKKSNTQK